jgi:hypothetical protein
MKADPMMRFSGFLTAAAIASLIAAYPLMLYAQNTSTVDEDQGVHMDELALAQILGRTHASFDICHIADTDQATADLDVIAKVRYIVSSRYRQLGQSADSAIRDERDAYAVYMEEHKRTPSLPDCQIFQRQIDALTRNAVFVSTSYIQTNELHVTEH